MAMGKDSKGIAASSKRSENDGLGTCKAHHVSIGPQEDRRCSKSEVGEGTGSENDGGVKYGARIKPATFGGGFSF